MSCLFVDNLTVLDFSYLHPGRGLLGESWRVDVVVEGSLDEQGMVVDFGAAKRRLREAVEEVADHRLLVPARHPGIAISDTAAGLEIRFPLDEGAEIRHLSPAGAVCLVPDVAVTRSAVAPLLVEASRRVLPDNVSGVAVELRESPDEAGAYQYSHGLKRHAGKCQRIAHGHRSRLRVWADGQRSPEHEARLAADWRDIYIGTREDVIAADASVTRFAYDALEGHFELDLPTRAVYLIDSESTVENLAEHLAAKCGRARPGTAFRVQAYEGLDKGAFGTV